MTPWALDCVGAGAAAAAFWFACVRAGETTAAAVDLRDLLSCARIATAVAAGAVWICGAAPRLAPWHRAQVLLALTSLAIPRDCGENETLSTVATNLSLVYFAFWMVGAACKA